MGEARANPQARERGMQQKATGICLIAPPVSRENRPLPLALLCLGGVLAERGINCQILDFNLDVRQNHELAGERFFDYARMSILATGCRLFGITSLCANYPLALRLAALIKAAVPGSIVVFGGPQASSVYEQTLRKFPVVDMIVVGEGEETLCELLDALDSGDDLHAIKGLAFRTDDDVIFTGPRPLIEEMDSFPFPAYGLVRIEDYLEDDLSDYLEIEAGRGCPFKCSFCSTSRMWKRQFRAKSPERLLDEMRFLNEGYGITRFGFVHDNLTVNPKYLKDLCETFIANGSPFQWSSSASLNTMKPEILDRMRASGCNGIFIGIETGSADVQRKIEKRLHLDKAEQVVRHAHQLGIRVDAAFIMGFPEEKRNDLDQTIRLALKLRKAGVERVFFNLLAPLAGTSLYHKYSQRMVLTPDESSLGTLPFGFDDVVPMIRDHPELFSSFYRIPNPALEDIPLAQFSDFMDEMIDWFTVAYENLLEVAGTMGMGPVDIFKRWLDWSGMQWKGMEDMDGSQVFNSFPDFLEDFKEGLSARQNKVSNKQNPAALEASI